ncbi:MAG: FG-GAP-like repeat-containing protein, partial [Cyanobacteria bacterium J06639_14]
VTNNTTGAGGGGSGLSSVIVANRFSGSISVFESDGTGGFGTPTTFATGTQPFAVALGDINQDGLDDVVVANRGSDTLSLLINDGTGGFLAAQDFTVGAQPVHVILEDINSDGYLDALVPNNSGGTVSVLLGNTSGGFDPQTTVVTGVGPWEVAMADMNNDGNLDLLTVNVTDQVVTVNLGDGLGSFAATSGTYGVGARPEGLVLEDVNNDGNLDFLVSNASSRTVSVGLGDGLGGFAATVDYGTAGNSPSPIAVDDLNGDGFADIAVGNTGADTLAVLLNNGDGTFAAPNIFSLGDQSFDIILRDVNGDSALDVLSANAGSDTVTVLAGDGAGNFSLLATLNTEMAPSDLAFGNLSGGGVVDPTAPMLVSAVVSGTANNSTLKLIYNERLDGDADPVAGDYTVTVNGVAQAVASVDVLPGTDAEGTNVILTMANPIAQGDVVSVSYTPGSTAVQDLDGNDAASFTNQAVTNLRDFTLTYSFMTVGDVFDFTEFGYTYDDGYVTNFDTLPTEAANTTNLAVRKNAADMTEEEIDAYVNAILTLKETTVLTDNGIEISLYDQFVAAHVSTADAIGRQAPDSSIMRNPAHGGAGFMPWHRLLLIEYENALQAVNPNVTLPYWDWTDLNTTMNVLLQDNFMGPAAQGDVTTGYFSESNGWGVRNDLSGGRWTGLDSGTDALGRGVGVQVQNPGTWETNVQASLGQNGYNLFANNVERSTGNHNNAHGFIGGIMSNVSASPNDPIFWMLHSNVDRLWAEWQVNNHWGNNFYVPEGSESYGHNLNDPLFLWDNGVIPIATDLRDLLPKFPGANASAIVNGNTTIEGDLQNSGVVTPGSSPGKIHVEGNYIQDAVGELTIEIAGRKRGEKYDFLKVDGTASLDGTLNVYFLGDFAPQYGTFTFLAADSIEGDFTDINIFGLETPIDYRFYKSDDGKAYKLEMMGLDESGESGYGVAQTSQALYEDTDLNLYNPRFGRGLDMYVYGHSVHHGWDYNGEDALVDHSAHGGGSDWYLPYDVDISEWITALNNGEAIPEEYMSPMMHGDHGDHGGMDHGDHDMDGDMNHDDHGGQGGMDHGDHDMDDDMAHGGMDHGDHDMGGDMNHGDHGGMDHGDHDMGGDMAHGGMDHGDHDMDGDMNHGDHGDQGGMDHGDHDMGGDMNHSDHGDQGGMDYSDHDMSGDMNHGNHSMTTFSGDSLEKSKMTLI